jgi:hypothetical protein
VRSLSSYPRDEVKYLRSGRHRGALEDPKTSQRIELSSDEPFVVHRFDEEDGQWNTGSPDGVMLAEVDGVSWVCFIELKGSADVAKAFRQLEEAARHFAPEQRGGGENRTHGDDHHDRFGDRTDPLELMPARAHDVVGVFVTFRQLPRALPRTMSLAGKQVRLVAVQLPKKHPNHAETTPRDLLRKAAVIP